MIFSHVLYQLSYLGIAPSGKSALAAASEPGRYSEGTGACPAHNEQIFYGPFAAEFRSLRGVIVVGAAPEPGSRRCIVPILVRRSSGAGNGISAPQPAPQVDIPAPGRAERAIGMLRLLTTNGTAARAGWLWILIGHLMRPLCQVGSSSAARTQAKWIGKPSPTSIETTSVSGRPTTLEYEPTIFCTKQPASP